jgi:hypothetical protein
MNALHQRRDILCLKNISSKEHTSSSGLHDVTDNAENVTIAA